MTVAWAGVVVIALYIAVRCSMEALRRRRLRASALRFSEPGPARLSPGLTTLAGTVETDEPEGVAIRLCAPGRSFVFQPVGEPRWDIHATEAERSFEVHPFTLVVAGTGVRVRVRPDANVNLLSWPESVGPETDIASERTHALTLHAGERVLVSGMLAPMSPGSAAYRGGEHELVLQAPRGGALVIEAEYFAARRDRTPRMFRRIGDVIFGVVAVSHLVLLGISLHERDRATPLESPNSGGMLMTLLVMLVIALLWATVALHVGREPERP